MLKQNLDILKETSPVMFVLLMGLSIKMICFTEGAFFNISLNLGSRSWLVTIVLTCHMSNHERL